MTPSVDAQGQEADLYQKQQSLMQDVLVLLLMGHLTPLP